MRHLLRAVCFGVLATGCASEPDQDAPSSIDPVEMAVAPGPFEVGYRVTSLSYEGQTGSRTLRVAWWYPTAETDGTEAVYNGFFPAGEVWADAPVLEGEDPYPLVIYSHGHQGYAEASGFLMAHFASHGFVAVAPDHTGNTTFDGSDRDTEIYVQRPEDLSAVLDVALDGEIAEIQSDQVVAVGHSFGGYSLFAAGGAAYDPGLPAACEAGTGPMPFCSTWDADYEAMFSDGFVDERIRGLIPMAAGDYGLFGDAGVQEVDVPVLLMTGGLDTRTGDDTDDFWGALGGDPRHTWAHLPAAGHDTFTDFSGTLDQAEGQLEAEAGFEAIRGMALGWTLSLLGDERFDPVESGEASVSEHLDVTPGG